MKKALLVATLISACLAFGGERDKDKDKDKKAPASKIVDSGSFGIYMNGKRIGTETFRISQGAEMSTVTSEIKVDAGTTKAIQESEMQVAPNGNLKVYTWRSSAPQKEESVVEPKDQFLVEHITPADQKRHEVPYILPLSTVILDDNFFTHREVLIWRYLAAGCDRQMVCTASQFSFLSPHQHASGTARIELVGRDKVNFKGTERELNKIKLDLYDGSPVIHIINESAAEATHWLLWVDDSYMVVKMAVANDSLEVVRD
ncbi:MAG TPA: hypothetical protein VKZ53_03260 [Candidatus Angelobacter sp.]|nr:hypothetical protein [Candidatus Angelobacter sp.]